MGGDATAPKIDADALEPSSLEVSGASGRIRQSRAGLRLPDDRFIPVLCEDVVDAIVAQRERFGSVSQYMESLAAEMEHIIDQETTAFQRMIARRYDRFNPARETQTGAAEPDDDGVAEIQQMIRYLLEKANYERLDPDEIEKAIRVASSHGMAIRVDPDRLVSLDLYVRGQKVDEHRRRSLRAPIRGVAQEVEVFSRLVVVFQFRGEPWLNLKLFRDIPFNDLEALLPHAEAAMSIFDRLKVAGGGAGAFGGVAWKLLTGTAVLGQLAWAGIAALFGLTFRAFFGYRRAKHHRSAQMTHNLYYRIVANNAGVLELLLGNIGQEELKEAMLGYALLRHEPEIASAEELGEVAARWLEETFGVHVDFDAEDAIETMERFDLWEDKARLVPLMPDVALSRVREHWQQRKSRAYHLDAWRAPPRANDLE